MKHIRFEIKSLKLNLIKNNARHSLISRIQDLWCNHSHSWVLSILQMLLMSGHFSHWSFSLLLQLMSILI